MKQTDGKCRIDAVELGEVELNLLHAAPVLVARYAFANAVSGTRYGMGNKNQGWSEETLTKLAELQASMETDIVNSLFEGEVDPTERVSVEATTSDGVPGL